MSEQKLRIVADAHIWGVESAFSALPGFDVDLHILENRDICRQTLMDTDILLTRSSTIVNANLLAETAVRFAATATIGDDHYDKQWLDANNITWANAAGSSTGSVIEYMLAVLLEMQDRDIISIPNTTIGIIGVGRIGRALATVCQSMGMNILLNDPPRSRSEGEKGFCSLDQLLNQADLLTLHTPLIRGGDDCTKHLLNAERLNQFKGRGIINAARGSCVDNMALVQWLDDDTSRFAALDCWEHEPHPDRSLLAHAGMAIATPHIAGHSLDGKATNTQYIYHALCHYLHIEPVWNIQNHLPSADFPHTISAQGGSWHQLHTAANYLYPLAEDDETMKSWSDLTHSELAHAFSGYRRHYPARRAWHCSPIHFTHADEQALQLANAIGIKVV